jgi:hypothetical protein
MLNKTLTAVPFESTRTPNPVRTKQYAIHAISSNTRFLLLHRNGQSISSNRHIAQVLYSSLHLFEQSSRKHWFKLVPSIPNNVKMYKCQYDTTIFDGMNVQYPSASNSSHNVAADCSPLLSSEADTVHRRQFSD